MNAKHKDTRKPRTFQSPEGYLDIKGVAKMIGKTTKTVRRYMDNGLIPYLKFGKGRSASVVFEEDQIRKHLRAKCGHGYEAVAA